MEQPVEDFLAHFGIKGMRWGHRKQADISSNPTGKSKLSGKKKFARNLAVGVVGGAAVGALIGTLVKRRLRLKDLPEVHIRQGRDWVSESSTPEAADMMSRVMSEVNRQTLVSRTKAAKDLGHPVFVARDAAGKVVSQYGTKLSKENVKLLYG